MSSKKHQSDKRNQDVADSQQLSKKRPKKKSVGEQDTQAKKKRRATRRDQRRNLSSKPVVSETENETERRRTHECSQTVKYSRSSRRTRNESLTPVTAPPLSDRSRKSVCQEKSSNRRRQENRREINRTASVASPVGTKRSNASNELEENRCYTEEKESEDESDVDHKSDDNDRYKEGDSDSDDNDGFVEDNNDEDEILDVEEDELDPYSSQNVRVNRNQLNEDGDKFEDGSSHDEEDVTMNHPDETKKDIIDEKVTIAKPEYYNYNLQTYASDGGITRIEKLLTDKFENEIKPLRQVVASLSQKVVLLQDEVVTLSRVNNLFDNVKKMHKMSNKDKVIEKRLHLFDSIFCDEFFQFVMGTCVSGYCEISFFADDSSSLNIMGLELKEKTRELLSIIFFSRQPDEGKDKFTTDIGKLYSNFRRGIMLTAVLALQKDRLHLFEPSDEVIFRNGMSIESTKEKESSITTTPDGSQSGVGNMINRIKRIKQPFWLRNSYITADDCDEAIRWNETEVEKKKTASKRKDISTVDRDDIVPVLAKKIYSKITNVMHKCRDSGKVAFFYEIGYLFVGWSHLSLDIKQENMRLKWIEENSNCNIEFEHVKDMKTIPMHNYLTGTDGPVILNANNHNIAVMGDELKKYKSMILIAEHEVLVKKSAKSKFVKTTIRRSINIIDVVCKFLASYTEIGIAETPLRFLATNKSSLRSIIAISLYFRSMIDDIVRDTQKNGITWNNMIMKNGILENEPEILSNSMIKLFQPTPTKQKENLGSAILKMTEPEFQSRHVQLTNVEPPVSSMSVDKEAIHIEADAGHNIFEIN